MAKGYWVFFADVSDPEAYKAYMTASDAPRRKYGGRFLTRGGKNTPQEGKPRQRIVVVEYPSYEAALEAYRSPEYQAAKKLRDGKAVWDLAITEGYEGPQ